MKKTMLCSLVLLVFVCSAVGTCSAKAAKPVTSNVQKVFTLAQLAAYDGKEGRPAYVAVDGIVYDQTGVPAWMSGGHKGGKAGTDISSLIKRAPHGLKVLGNRKVVGRLEAQAVSKNIQK